ncbi:MAG: cation-translocating P-type ATPase, partial [Clostridia bacterium]|nr:cation-translocating P-type ATPase [Clostridia bacterium]
MAKIRGLTSKEVEAAREKYGTNKLKKEKQKGFLGRFFENLNDPIIRILIIALVMEVVFTLGKCNYFEVGGIIIAILIATLVSTVSEMGSENAFRKISEGSEASTVRAVRDGALTYINANDIVVGDLLLVSAAEQICADGYIVSGKITVDQSALNGEGAEANKSAGGDRRLELDCESAVFRGSIVTDGEAYVKVARVGGETFYGSVAREIQAQTRESPLKLRLSRLAGQISKIGYVMAALVALTYLFFTYVVDNGFDGGRIISALSDYKGLIASLIHALTLMITVVVVAVPEGLPMMITVVLSANMKRMLKDKILVKKLVGIETAGSLNILFTDKTGTLTTGVLECDRIITPEGSYKSAAALRDNTALYRGLLINAKYNTDTYLEDGKILGGNSTDRAIASFFFEEKTPEFSLKSKKTFTSSDKYSSVSENNGLTYIKGAGEVILSLSRYILSPLGERVLWDFSTIEAEYLRATERGERVIAVATSEDGELCNLTFLALIVLKDKLRTDVKNALMQIKSAGIRVVMLTGDGEKTAAAIAEECGIYYPSGTDVILTSSALAAMSDTEVMEILPRLKVLARALPTDKTRLVRLSQQMDLVVGMTGDGINDAPSLKLADVGFAMGSGTDIAKSAGDIVIIDNSLTAISKTVLYGRTIFKSIRKFITFQLIMNLTACGVSLLGQFIGIDNPITIIQMLWINIIMDTLGGLAFAAEPPLKYYMKEPPKRRDEPILSREMIYKVFTMGGYTLLLCAAFLRLDIFRGFYGADVSADKFLTAFYALFVFSGLCNCFIARS